MIRTALKRLVLRSPMHQTISRRFLLLVAIDGVDLQPAVPLRYATHDGVHIVLGEQTDQWWRAVADAEAPVTTTVRFKGRLLTVPASMAGGELLDESVLRYLQKYPGEWTALGVQSSATPEEMEAAAHGVAVVLFTPGE